MNISVIIHPEPEGGFTVIVPSLPGCITYGKNLAEARKMAQEAISLYLEDMVTEGEKLPDLSPSYLTQVEVNIPHALHVNA